MPLTYSPLFSGSSGNAVYVGDGSGGVLIDAGYSATKIIGVLGGIGVDPRALRAILVTHAHSDHVLGVGAMSRKFDLPIFASAACWAQMGKRLGKLPPKNRCVIEAGTDLYFGALNVMPFETPHDADGSVGYLFEYDGVRFALATDLGSVRKSWLEAVIGSDAVLLESNYDPAMLEAGPYSYELKRRIASPHGHLSNDDAGHVAVELCKSGARHIILGHLSKENNTPELARLTCENALRDAGILPGEDIRLDVAKRDDVTGIFQLGREET